MMLKGAAIGLLLAFGSPAALASDVVIDLPGDGTVVRSPVDLRQGMEVILSGTMVDANGCEYDAFYGGPGRTCPDGKDTLIKAMPGSQSGVPTMTLMYWLKLPYPAADPSHEYHMTIEPPKGALQLGRARLCVAEQRDTCGGSPPLKGDFKMTILNADAPEQQSTIDVTFDGEVVVRRAGGDWTPLAPGTPLQPGDEVFTGVDSHAVVKFPDGSELTLSELTQIDVTKLLRTPRKNTTVVKLSVGEIKAQVAKEKAVDTDFQVRTATATTSVRGTAFSVFHDPGSRATLVAVTQHKVVVNPTKRGLRTKTVRAGKEVEVTRKSISRVTRLGKAGARGGIDRSKAFHLVGKLLSRASQACGLATSPGGSSFVVAPRAGSWLVTVKLTAPAAGPATWSVTGSNVTPTNALAQRITASCG
jgi:hypothetical protein